jgi:putative membrane protein
VDLALLLLLVLAFAVLGSLAGIGSGLIPGVHVNNVALVAVALWPALAGILAPVTGGDTVLLVAALLASASVAHGIASLLPSVFLGAPDAETALSVLPGHRLLAQGRGYEAVVLGARGAMLATFVALAFLLPFRLLLGSPVDAYDRLRPVMPFLLLFLVALLIATEGREDEDPRRANRRRLHAVGLLLIAGILGATVLSPGFLSGAWRPVPVPGESLVLFPLFTGLFGLPTLILSMGNRGRLPPQDLGPPEPLPDWRRTRGLLSGTLAGAAVSWFPGLGGANATVIAQLLAGGEPRADDADADREFLFAASAANAATAVFTFATLFVILRARSGVAAAVDTVSGGVDPWQPLGQFPPIFAAVLLALAVSAVLASRATVRLARPFALFAGRVRYGRLARFVVGGLVLGVFLLTGPLGLAVLGTATAIGLVPPLVGVRRVHLMGCLLLPLLLAAV